MAWLGKTELPLGCRLVRKQMAVQNVFEGLTLRCPPDGTGVCIASHIAELFFFFCQCDAKAVVTIGMNFSDER